MGCGPSQDTAPAATKQGMTVYGDYYCADTCALIAMLKKCEADFKFELIDSFNKADMQAYLEQNATGQFPMLEHNGTKVISGGDIIFKWVVSSHATRFNPVD